MWTATKGNPIWEEINKIALKVLRTVLVNVTLNREKQTTGAFAGDLLMAQWGVVGRGTGAELLNDLNVQRAYLGYVSMSENPSGATTWSGSIRRYGMNVRVQGLQRRSKSAAHTTNKVQVILRIAQQIRAVEHQDPRSFRVALKGRARPIGPNIAEWNIGSHRCPAIRPRQGAIQQSFQFRQCRQAPIRLAVQRQCRGVIKRFLPMHLTRRFELPLQSRLGILPDEPLFLDHFWRKHHIGFIRALRE